MNSYARINTIEQPSTSDLSDFWEEPVSYILAPPGLLKEVKYHKTMHVLVHSDCCPSKNLLYQFVLTSSVLTYVCRCHNIVDARHAADAPMAYP